MLKKIAALLLVMIVAQTGLGAVAESTEGPRILVAYYSRWADIEPTDLDGYSSATLRVNNTAQLAEQLAGMTGGDLFEIQVERNYPLFHSENSAIAREEKDADARPLLLTSAENFDQYDVIILGYPIWWYTAPMAIRSFLEAYDFTGKTILPFCTSIEVAVEEESMADIARLCQEAVIGSGLTIRNGAGDHTEDLLQWLTENGISVQ